MRPARTALFALLVCSAPGCALSFNNPVHGHGGTSEYLAAFKASLVLLLHFDETVWSGTPLEVLDSSIFGPFHGQAINGALNIAGGARGRGGSFTGASSQIVKIPHNNTFTNPNELTLLAWVKTTSGGVMSVLSNSSPAANGVVLEMQGGQAGIFWDFGTGTQYAGPLINDGAWHQIVGTFNNNSTTMSLYVDGAFVTSWAGTYNLNTDDAQVGAVCAGAGSTGCLEFFSGLVDEVAIFNRALSPVEVSQTFSGI